MVLEKMLQQHACYCVAYILILVSTPSLNKRPNLLGMSGNEMSNLDDCLPARILAPNTHSRKLGIGKTNRLSYRLKLANQRIEVPCGFQMPPYTEFRKFRK